MINLINFSTGMCTTFCTPCQIYQTAEDLNKSGMLYCLLSCFMPCIPVLLLRGEAREKYGIEVSYTTYLLSIIIIQIINDKSSTKIIFFMYLL